MSGRNRSVSRQRGSNRDSGKNDNGRSPKADRFNPEAIIVTLFTRGNEETFLITPPQGDPYPSYLPRLRGDQGDSRYPRRKARCFPFSHTEEGDIRQLIVWMQSGRRAFNKGTFKITANDLCVVHPTRYSGELVIAVRAYHAVSQTLDHA